MQVGPAYLALLVNLLSKGSILSKDYNVQLKKLNVNRPKSIAFCLA